MYDNKFKDILKQERENKNLTQEQLGEKIGVRKQTIFYYEKGDKFPTIPNLELLADVLDCSTDYLLGRTTNRHSAIVKLKDEKHTYEVEVDEKHKDEVTLETIYELLIKQNIGR